MHAWTIIVAIHVVRLNRDCIPALWECDTDNDSLGRLRGTTCTTHIMLVAVGQIQSSHDHCLFFVTMHKIYIQPD